jgi:hypothetical protein
VAVQVCEWTGHIDDVRRWLVDIGHAEDEKFFELKDAQLIIKTLEGNEHVSTIGSIIIRGVQGEYYFCRRDIFMQTYDYPKINV